MKLVQQFSLLFFILIVSTTKAQQLNVVDNDGFKQGVWEFLDNYENIILTGSYKDDKPEGEFKYYQDTRLVLTLFYGEDKNEFKWECFENSNSIKGFSKLSGENKREFYFENGQKLTQEEIKRIPSYETEVAYIGGLKELSNYLGQHLKYPEKAKNKSIEGKVYIKFVIDEQGKIVNAKIIKGFDKECDKEALRVIKSMPNWQPATQRGYTVKMQQTLPINFKL